jgi:glycosyltransferase involved in cell wall biosynthesis
VLISLVIPVFNEVDSLAALHRELSEVAARCDDDFEFIFIDDGSSDGSWSVVRSLSDEDARVRGVRFRRNFGKAAALMAGFQTAHGELVFTMDADLQDDPHEIPHFLAAIEQGFDVVSGWKQIRHDPWHKVFPSHVFNKLVSWMTGVVLHDHNCGIKCYRREVVSELNLYGGMYRFAMVLAAARGFKVGEIVVHHRARQFGISKYGPTRFLKGLLDLVTVWFRTKFGDRPQHVFGTTAAIVALVGLVGLVCGYPWFAVGTFVLAGQLFATGLVAEMLSAQNAARTELFEISERVGAATANRVEAHE